MFDERMMQLSLFFTGAIKPHIYSLEVTKFV